MSKVILMDFITRRTVIAQRNWCFLYGDNLGRRGFGGQAREMRGEPNAFGIPTKRSPTMAENAFLTDSDFETVRPLIDEAFQRAAQYDVVVIPRADIGTGLAQLPQRAPRIADYIEGKIEELKVATLD